MINDVRKLAHADHEARKAALLALLQETGADYQTQRKTVDGILVENFIVKFGSARQRIVAGAHYDSVEGSTGANDNASGVSILVELVKRFATQPPDASLDIVFFDYEESQGLGSTLYFKEYGNTIRAMINADICGVGDSILIAPQKNLTSGLLANAVKKLDPQTLGFRILDRLPTGDERIFEENSIENISVCIVEEKDVEPMSTLFAGRPPASVDDYPSIIETMHNGCRDTAAVVEQSALNQVMRFLYELIIHIPAEVD
ncbi:MAG: M28 family peptidase [Clostridiales bacterium]|nr:M28 family peptidase [Clostridiales bacterium]